MQIYKLTKSLFRQAQLLELQNIDVTELYERCIGLRQYPHLIESYPTHLKHLLTNVVHNSMEIFDNKLKLNHRNGLIFEYTYNHHFISKILLLKYAYIASIISSSNDVNTYFEHFDEKIAESKIFDKFIKDLDVSNDFESENLDISNDFESENLDISNDFESELLSETEINTESKFDSKYMEDKMELHNLKTLMNSRSITYAAYENGFKNYNFCEKISQNFNIKLDYDNFTIEQLSKPNNSYNLYLSVKNQHWGYDCHGCSACTDVCFGNCNNNNFYY